MMGPTPTPAQMNKFFDDFGTHAQRTVSMGARFVAEATFSK